MQLDDRMLLASLITISLLFTPTTNAFASWFVDRQLSCFTDLAADEIIMNNIVKPYSVSQEPSIRIEVSPLGADAHAAPNSEYAVTFIVPEDARTRLQDIEYVMELSSGSGSDTEDREDPPAKFTTEPPNGGIGCDGRRSSGKLGKDDATGILTISQDAVPGARLEITAGWATGHDAVTLTEKVVLFIGHGSEQDIRVDDDDDDDALDDDEAEAELEQLLIEEEREFIKSEIETAEEDAVEALEEKRLEAGGLGSDINVVEDHVIEALEESGEGIEKALDSLKDEVVQAQLQRQRDQLVKHDHTAKQRIEAQKKHREHHDMTHTEGKLDEMYRRYTKKLATNSLGKVAKLLEMKDTLKKTFKKLHKMDKKETEKARHEHIQPLARAELQDELKVLKQRAKEKMHKLSETLGVNELMNDPHLKQIRGHLRKGLKGNGNGAHHGDVGKPLPPEGRHFFFVMFTLFGIVGLVRWALDKRRRMARKGRRNL